MLPGDETRLGDIVVHAVPAYHPFARDAIGFVIRGEKTVYFSGDTRYTPALRDALWTFSIDIALVQAACSRYPLVGKDGMDLEDAARFAAEIKPKIVIPIHYQVKGKTIAQEELLRWEVTSELVVLEPGVPRVI
jgi:L-ascorbate metabolism protein UlaG (beta-lactamase superfamily)